MSECTGAEVQISSDRWVTMTAFPPRGRRGADINGGLEVGGIQICPGEDASFLPYVGNE